MTTLTDIYHIRLNGDMTDMSEETKTDLLNDANQLSEGKKKGLIITFDLSSSYRLTNNRLYSAKGQKAGISSWTKPYPKPILRNHDRNSDPIGRIISVDWVSNDQEALKFFNSTNDFMSFKRIMDAGDPQTIYKEMRKRNLLTDESWPGMGKLVAKARISDPDAIEKFLDGRYFTFSAGSSTDSYTCGICGQNWAAEGQCEHSPGSIDDEGRPAVMLTGAFIGREASVVTVPGNDLSQLVSMEFGDSAEVSSAYAEYAKHQDCEIAFVDASVFTGDNMADATTETVSETADLLTQVQNLIADKNALALLKQALLEKENEDAVNEDGQVEGSVQVSQPEGQDGEEEEACTEEEACKENVDQEIVPEQVKQEEVAVAEDTAEETQVESTDTAEETVEDAVADETALEAVEDAACEVDAEDDTDVDWFLLDCALDRMMGDKMLTAKQRKDLPDEAFCGPERSFPVPDCDHVTAARRMIGLSKLSSAQKGKVLSCVSRKEKAMNCASAEDATPAEDCGCTNSEDKLKSVLVDYKAALKLATELQEEVNSLKEKLSQLDTAEEPSHDDDKKTLSVDDVKPVENESVSSSQVLSDSVKELGDYEKNIVSKYNELRDMSGEQVANKFLRRKFARGHLPRNFDITPHIQENN